MQKLIAGLFAAILATAGLVALTSAAPASAACTGYVCVPTTTKATAAPKTVRVGNAVKVKVLVQVRGNATVRGSVTLSVRGPGGYKKTLKVQYNDRQVTFNLGKPKKAGRYKLTAKYTGVQGFRNSAGTGSFTVKKRR